MIKFTKKCYPWIPVVGSVLTLCTDCEATGLDSTPILLASALFQAVSILVLLVLVTA